MYRAALVLFVACWAATAQVVVSMDLVPGRAVKSTLGSGQAAYAWNIHVCALGSKPVPWQAVRLEFPEVRFYLPEQQAAILAARVEASVPARLTRLLSWAAIGGGAAVQAETARRGSPGQVGTTVSLGGIVLAALQPVLARSVPVYTIPDPVPSVLALPAGGCADYTALAAAGKAPATATIPVRRVNPIPAALP